MERNKKKRVAHIGQYATKKQCHITNDVVTDIINKMDCNIADTGNQEFYEILNSVDKKGTQSNLKLQSSQNSFGLTLPKKFQTKRPSLMEKARKSITYLKHNRTMPKPRAHLGGLRENAQRKEKETLVTACPPCPIKNKKEVVVSSVKKRKNESSCDSDSFSDECGNDSKSKCRALVESSSDSESEFESFIRVQKQNIEWEDNKKSRKKEQLRKKPTKNKTKRKGSKIASKMTSTNRRQLPDTSDTSIASTDENKPSGQLLKTKSTPFIPTAEIGIDSDIEPSEQLSLSDFERIECHSNLQGKGDDGLSEPSNTIPCDLVNIRNFEQINCHTELQGKKDEGWSEKKNEIAESDDECLIICEVPKSVDHFHDTYIAEKDNIESDIKILNVVSLETNEEGTNAIDVDIPSKIPSSSCDKNLSEVNYETIKEALETVKFITDPSNALHKTAGNCPTMTVEKLNGASSSVTTNILETANQIDFQQILAIVHNKCDKENDKMYSSPEVKVFNSSPCSSSLSAFVELNDSKLIAENHWHNLKEAVSMKSFDQNNFSSYSECSENLNLKLEDNSSLTDNTVTPSRESSNSNILNLTSLKKILSNAEQLTQSSRLNSFQDEYSNSSQIFEEACDELDLLSTTSVEDLCRNESSPNLMRLLKQYTQAYINIESTEQSAAMGLKMLQKAKIEKRRHLEVVLKHILNNTGDTENANTTETEDPSCIEMKDCVNCGLRATIECAKCKKVYFCSEKCGVTYWEGGHYKHCAERTKEPTCKQ